MVEDVDADASHTVFRVLYEQIKLPVIVVIDPETALSIITPKLEPCRVADVVKGPVSIAFIKYISSRIILLGTRLKGRFDNNEIQVAISIVIAKGEAKPGPRIRVLHVYA